MILHGLKKQSVEINIHGLHGADRLNVQLQINSGAHIWKTESPLLLYAEAAMLLKLFRKLRRKNYPYRNYQSFAGGELIVEATITKNEQKKLLLRLGGKCKPPFIKDAAFLHYSVLSDEQLRELIYLFNEQLPVATPALKDSIAELSKREKFFITRSVDPEFVEYDIQRKPAKAMGSAAVISPGTNSVCIRVEHTGENERSNSPVDAFWKPFQLAYSKSGNEAKSILPRKECEAVLMNNLSTLLAERMSTHFSSSFFELDARYRKGAVQHQRGRIDEAFISLQQNEPLYRQEADRFINAVFVKFNPVELSYYPFTVIFKVEPAELFCSVFDDDFKKMLHYLRKEVPQLFMQAIAQSGTRADYSQLPLKFTYWLGEGLKRKR